MVFVDVPNLEEDNLFAERRRLRTPPDYVNLVRCLTGPRRLATAYAFTAYYRSNDGYVRNVGIVDRLRADGFRVIAPTNDPGEVSTKEVDVALATELLTQGFAGAYDTAIVVSGDRDFLPAIRAVQRMGKRVEIAALPGTYTSRLPEAADRFHDLGQLPFFVVEEEA